MTVGSWAQLALGLVQLLNWIAGKIDQKDWENKGFLQAFEKALGITNERVNAMRKIDDDHRSKTEEEIINELTS